MGKFQQRKDSILKKVDKSSKGDWDGKVKGLCEKINSLDNYYTTSSCAGRVVVMKDVSKKGKGLFLKVSHDLVKRDFLKDLKISKKGIVKFKSEPFILHVVCKELKDAESLMKKAHKAGWKRAGIISLGKNIVVEINGTEKIEFSLVKDGEFLVDEKFLKVVFKKCNENLKKGWLKIDGLRKLF